MTACARDMALTLPSYSALRIFSAVMSVAYLTTFTWRPSPSKMGLYDACSHTSRPSLATRRYTPASNSPSPSLRQKSR